MVRFFPKKSYAYAGVFFVLILALHWLKILEPVENTFRSLFIAPLRYFNKNTQQTSVGKEQSSSTTAFAVIKMRLSLLEEENAHLREALNFKKSTSYNLVAADLVGQDSANLGQFFIINKGFKDGIARGQPVITDNGILVGTVNRADSKSAVIILINDHQSKVAGTILNNIRSIGVVEGGYGITLRLKLIPRNEIVAVGDQVITSGLEDFIPRGLLIGTIAEVENEAYKPFQQAVLAPEVDLTKLTAVSVITTK